MSSIKIGHLLRSSTTGFVVGCSVAQFQNPVFGALVKAPLEARYQIYGLIYDIHIDDDGLVRQLVTVGNVDNDVMRDNRERRIVPVEMSVLTLGYQENGQIKHLLPPRPPLSLDEIVYCGEDELRQFTSTGRFGYFRHILRAKDAPIGELLAAHLEQAKTTHHSAGDSNWINAATQELITLLRDDYPTLMSVLGALGDAM